MKCCICGQEIEKKYTETGRMYWDRGNNADPVAHGRCCGSCDQTIVIPARLKEHPSVLKQYLEELHEVN